MTSPGDTTDLMLVLDSPVNVWGPREDMLKLAHLLQSLGYANLGRYEVIEYKMWTDGYPDGVGMEIDPHLKSYGGYGAKDSRKALEGLQGFMEKQIRGYNDT